MAKHTPGPWEVSVAGPSVKCAAIGPFYGLRLFTAHGWTWLKAQGVSTPEIRDTLKANAALVAASPDLLILVREAFDNGLNFEWMDRAKDAIAKAKGK